MDDPVPQSSYPALKCGHGGVREEGGCPVGRSTRHKNKYLSSRPQGPQENLGVVLCPCDPVQRGAEPGGSL